MLNYEVIFIIKSQAKKFVWSKEAKLVHEA